MAAIPNITTGDIQAKVGSTTQFGDLLQQTGAKITAPVFNFGSRASDILAPAGAFPWGLALLGLGLVGAVVYFKRRA